MAKTIKITNSLGFQLTRFLDVSPKEIKPLGEYGKVRRGRMALEKAIQEYKKEVESYVTRAKEEAIPLNRIWMEVLADGKLTEEQKKNRKSELDMQLQKITESIDKELDTYNKENGDKEVEVSMNEEDLNSVKKYFEEKGSEYDFWKNGDDYVSIAVVIGSLSSDFSK